MAEQERVLLPADVYPTRYDITLKPDLERFTFDGSETIDIEVKSATRRVVLHAAELEIHSVVLERDGVSRESRTHRDERGRRHRRVRFQRRAGAGSGTAGHRVHRATERQDARVLPECLPGGRRRADHGGHPVRGHGRPARVPVLGRAGAKGRVQGHAGGAGGPGGGVEHAANRRSRPGTTVSRPCGSPRPR